MSGALIKLILLSLLLIPTLGWSQLSIDDYISNDFLNSDEHIIGQQLDFLENNAYGLSPIRKLEFRTDNDEFVASEQEYALRLSPTNPWQIKANNEVFKAKKALLEIERSEEKSKVLSDKYEVVLAMIQYNEAIDIEERKLGFLKEEASIYEQQLGSNNFDAQDLINVRIDMIDQVNALSLLKKERLSLLEKIKQEVENFDATINWKFMDIMSVDSLLPRASEYDKKHYASVEELIGEKEIDLLSKEIKLEKSNRNIGFVQTDYIPSRTQKTPFAISLGIGIPIFNPNKPDMVEKRMERLGETLKLDSERDEKTSEEIQAFSQLKSTVHHYVELRKNIDSLRDNNFLSPLLQRKKYVPSSVIKMRKSLLKLERTENDARYECFLAYFAFLKAKGVFLAEGNINHLK